MKKIIFFSILLILALSFNVSALPDDPDEIRDILKNNFGFTDEDIPRDKEDIRQFYLKVRVTEKIKNIKVLNNLHSFFSDIPFFFMFFMAHSYELSLSFICVFILWLIFLIIGYKFAKAFGMKGWPSFVIGLAATLVLAQLRIYLLIVTYILGFIFKQDSWTVRIIIVVAALGILIFTIIFSSQFAGEMSKRRKGKREEQSEQDFKEMKALTEGMQKK